MRYTRISADSHIDMPWIPNDLFTRNATAALKDRMPYVADGPDGPYWTCRNAMSFGLVCGVGPAGQKHVPGQNYRVDMGVETLMWASDYPHTDGLWPESSKYIEEQFGHLPADTVHKITCENAARLYGLIA